LNGLKLLVRFQGARVGNGDRRRRCRRSFAGEPPSLKTQRRWKRAQRLSTTTPSVRRTAIRKKASVVNIAATPPAVAMPRQIFTWSAMMSSPPNLGGDLANFAKLPELLGGRAEAQPPSRPAMSQVEK